MQFDIIVTCLDDIIIVVILHSVSECV